MSGCRSHPTANTIIAGLEWPGNFCQLVGTLRVLAALAEPTSRCRSTCCRPTLRRRLRKS